MNEQPAMTCAACGKPVENLQTPVEEGQALYCSFGCEARTLFKGLGGGMRWLGISLVWGLLLFTFMVLIGWVIFGPAPARPGPFYGLIVVVGLLTLVLSVVRQRFKGE